jgi:hypothetical protein
MEKNCNKTITLDGDKSPGTFFSLTSGDYQQNLNCTLIIKAPTVNQRIIIVIDKMDIACGGDKILIYDGRKEQGSILNKNDSQQCGTSKYYLRVKEFLSTYKTCFSSFFLIDNNLKYGNN